MSSPSMVPQPHYRRPRTFFGPLVLIVIGVVFLLVNMGYMSYRTVGLWFARYWPVVLIVWGLLKLLDYYQARREGLPTRGLGAGGVFFLILLLIFGMMATQAVRYGPALVNEIDVDDEVFTLFGHTYSYSDELEQPWPADSPSLKVVSDRGDIVVTAWAENKVKVAVRKTVGAGSQAEADKTNETTRPTITVTAGLVTINANTGGAGSKAVRTNLEIFVPEKAALEIASRRGDILLGRRQGNVIIASQRGDIDVSEIGGALNATVRRGDLRASRISGDLVLDGSHIDDVTISDVGGAVRFNGEIYGSIHFAKIEKGLTFHSARTDLQLAKLTGELSIDGGDLRARSLTGPFSLTTRSRDIYLEEVAGDVRIGNTRGSVELRPSKLGNIEVENEHGGIQLILPPKAAFQLDARALSGDISSEFEQVSVNSRGRETTASGAVGSGGSMIKLHTEHGDIDLRRGVGISAAPPVPPAPPAPETPPVPKVSDN